MASVMTTENQTTMATSVEAQHPHGEVGVVVEKKVKKEKPMDGFYFKLDGQNNRTFRKTAKQFRIFGNDGTAAIVKPNKKLGGVLHDITFGNGTTRQWFLTSDRTDCLRTPTTTLEDYNSVLMKCVKRDGCRDIWLLDTFGFVCHPDDKVFTRERLVYALTFPVGEKEEKKDIGEPDLFREPRRVEYGDKAKKMVPVLVKETWVKWGGLNIRLDDGIYDWKTSHYDDYIYQRTPRKDSSVPLYQSECAFKEELAMKVFHPERVGRMQETYGEEWFECV